MDSDNLVVLSEGDHLFYENDEGGDLYFVTEGIVEIYKTIDDEEVTLGQSKEGDILGVMTIMDKSPRTASARALTGISANFIPHEKFSELLHASPKWVKSLIKDITFRLNQTNHKVIECYQKVKELEQIPDSTPLEIAGHVVDSFILLAKNQNQYGDKMSLISVEKAIENLISIMEYDGKLVSKVVNILISSNLLNPKLSQSGERLVHIDEVKNLYFFNDLVKEHERIGQGTKKASHFTLTELRTLNGLAKFVLQAYGNVDTRQVIPLTELKVKMEGKSGVKYNQDAIKKADSRGLIKVSRAGVEFTPKYLIQKVKSLNAMLTVKLEVKEVF